MQKMLYDDTSNAVWYAKLNFSVKKMQVLVHAVQSGIAFSWKKCRKLQRNDTVCYKKIIFCGNIGNDWWFVHFMTPQ